MASLSDFCWLVLLVISGASLLPVLVLVVEIIAAFLPTRERARTLRPARPRIGVVIPAYNEAEIISATLANIQAQMTFDDRLVVVADNCSDATEEMARALGAEVVRRSDDQRRGKSYAVGYGIRFLAGNPPDVVVVIDADCYLGIGSLVKIAATSASIGRPVQARYELSAPEPRGPYLAVATFAWRVKNYVRPLGLHHLGLPCQIMGTGFAAPWEIISSIDINTGELAEDLVLGIDLARQGAAPEFCPSATISSTFPVSDEGQQTQRARWETGHLTTIVKRLPSAFAAAIARGDAKLMALVLDAAVPPLAFLSLIIVGVQLASLGFAVVTGTVVPLVLATVCCALLVAAILMAWVKCGRDILTLRELANAPAYIFAKLPLYGRVLIGKRLLWVRSKRN